MILDRFDMTHGVSGGTREGSGGPHEGPGVFDRCCTCGQKSEKLFFSETPKNHVFKKKNIYFFDENFQSQRALGLKKFSSKR